VVERGGALLQRGIGERGGEGRGGLERGGGEDGIPEHSFAKEGGVMTGQVDVGKNASGRVIPLEGKKRCRSLWPSAASFPRFFSGKELDRKP